MVRLGSFLAGSPRTDMAPSPAHHERIWRPRRLTTNGYGALAGSPRADMAPSPAHHERIWRPRRLTTNGYGALAGSPRADMAPSPAHHERIWRPRRLTTNGYGALAGSPRTDMAPSPAHHERIWRPRRLTTSGCWPTMNGCGANGVGGYRVLAPLPLPFVPSGVPVAGPSAERDGGGRLSRDLGVSPRRARPQSSGANSSCRVVWSNDQSRPRSPSSSVSLSAALRRWIDWMRSSTVPRAISR